MKTKTRLFQAISTVGLLLLASAPVAVGQESADQQTCLKKLNTDGIALAKKQALDNFACLKRKAAGTLVGTAQSCQTADPKGQIQNKKNKTLLHETNFCTTAPDFGYTSGAAINTGAVQGALDLTVDLFGADLDAAVIVCASNKPGCKCQQSIFKKVRALAALKFSTFFKCKKAALHNGANSVAALKACVNDAGTAGSIAADTNGKILRSVTALTNKIVVMCDTPGVTGAFPGNCNSMTGSTLSSCLDRQAECRVCQIINDMDGLFVNCDLFDDNIANGSCASGAGPTPTPTITMTPTNTPTTSPTVTPTNSPTTTPTLIPGVTYRGSLLQSTGRFTYSATVGLAGSDKECTIDFGNAHTCTYAQLQTADSANELVGATDVGSNPVTEFWAIDSMAPGIQQCGQTIPWDYQTAHTGHFGNSVPLNGMGHLGMLHLSNICASPHSVGCCQ